MTLKPGQMTIEVHSRTDAFIVAIAGEVDLCTAPDLVAALDHTLRGGPPLVVVDLTEVTFLASAGLQALLFGARSARPETAFVVVATGIAARPIRLTHLDEIFAVYPDRVFALAHIPRDAPKQPPATSTKEPVARTDSDAPFRPDIDTPLTT